jgi:hypothetical protein
MATTGARSPQFAQYQAGGAFAYADIRRHPADVWFVDSTNSKASDTAGFGQNPELPFATLQYANTQAADSVGDVIYLMPGHVETVIEAGGLTLDCIGLTVRGLGEGALQPMIECTTINTVDILINAASITIEDVHFQSGVLNIIAMIDVDATDFTLRRCRFSQGGVNQNPLITIQDAAAQASDRITVEYCEAILQNASNSHFINIGGDGDGHIIRNNSLIGDWGTVVIGGTGTPTYLQVSDNYIHNVATTADSGINVDDASTGIVCNNLIGITLAGNATTGVDCDGCALLENYVVDIGDRSGVLDPVATT